MDDSVWIVTYINDMQLVSQYAYVDFKKAEAKAKELVKKLYADLFERHKGFFSEGETVMDFQFSEPWWDEDCRTAVHLYEARLE